VTKVFTLFAFVVSSSNPELLNTPECVLDQCDKNTCVVETPEGSVEVRKKPNYKEGAIVDCPLPNTGS